MGSKYSFGMLSQNAGGAEQSDSYLVPLQQREGTLSDRIQVWFIVIYAFGHVCNASCYSFCLPGKDLGISGHFSMAYLYAYICMVFSVLMSKCFGGGYECFGEMYCLHLRVEVTMKMEAICSSETLVNTYKTAWHYNPEDYNQCLYLIIRTSSLHHEFAYQLCAFKTTTASPRSHYYWDITHINLS